MFQHILVPLDGSACSEQALPLAAQIARSTGSKVTLMRVAQFPGDYYAFVYSSPLWSEDFLQVTEDEAQDYLDRMRTDSILSNIPVETEVIAGGPTASVLVKNSQIQNVDLIVMCCHGYTGLKQFIIGSIAHQVTRHSMIPILVLHEDHTGTQAYRRISHPFPVLVALDGSRLAETALLPAATLSTILSAPQSGSMHLLRVVQPVFTSIVSTRQAVKRANDAAIEAAKDYLTAVEEKIKQKELISVPLEISSSVCLADHVASTLVEAAEQGDMPFSALAVATHGRNGITRWLSGSVTESVLNHTKLPLLIVRQQQQKEVNTVKIQDKDVVGSKNTYSPFAMY
jgi:nucleotide-binding universal stress UspA family protein